MLPVLALRSVPRVQWSNHLDDTACFPWGAGLCTNRNAALQFGELTRRLKADSRTRHIPIIAVTGHALTGYSDSAMKAGCDAFVTKPCLPDTLVAEVRRLLTTPAEKSGRRKRRSHA